MRLALGSMLPVFGAVFAFACGETASDGDHTAGAAGQSATAGAAGSSSAAGTTSIGGGGVAGTTGSGGSSAGAGTAGTTSSGGSGDGGVSGGGSAGDSNEGGGVGGSGLVDCDTRKVLCRIVTPDCPAGEVPSVKGTCYGECVKIDRCSCTSADQCPEPEQYTCLKGPMHCSYYLK
ncbi:MAG TPA: hypothetical protein VHB79_00120 [Polyangiaceae bacterium]|nr:hypothetical protein [Polyangiaceae bacterium]